MQKKHKMNMMATDNAAEDIRNEQNNKSKVKIEKCVLRLLKSLQKI